ncbi:quinoprotein glucose dehydrogenase [Prosthecobacter fusiformis]|uniref:Quinoprotein glucose dehydrogenase n=1 Tax=Prosthecobacter fusiformis TaxID=48464 RepID=A0A4R7RZD7_9BACT|nr:PQQ-dependent sugar dehydrogenase [Prosthecobacter fusiformis]TDU71292.1 quinoprotein glucose dehydrogenase [Prosthecobacter fusiformis]
MKLASLLTTGLLLASSALAQDTVKLARIYEKLDTKFPIAVVIPPDGSQRQFLALQRGQILILPKDEQAAEAKTFLDLSTRAMEADNGKFEEGLNGLAFHPKYKENGLFYLCYTLQKPKRLVVTEMKVSADADKADESTERTLLEIPLINWNHHGGNILFGPDGYLYMGVGDTSKRNDEQRMAQLNAVLVGKVLRIDVDSREYKNAYGIPADNPFADGVNALPQIYAYGIRNPWGMYFDAKDRLWLADVGQDLWEEINWIVKGGNYGWSFREGSRPFPLRLDPAPAEAKLIDPIHEYHHGDGLSITGGIVYTGTALPELKDAYIYGDFVLGKIWALKVSDEGKVESNTLLYTSPQTVATDAKKKPSVHMKPTAFCADANGELLVLDWNGAIHRLSK